ncbi:hypothetical protein EmuJ_000435860 [Echinococcus multilocularis]|uniref:Uncharacterized protein n=1 Tax=Echinococcus multilocularis TaxID=6211 RepID=A0A068XXH8_ECHMU|nr:hypothetical protein EmuJ_000435860 [Echinococcus multilocularis]
MGTKPCVVDAVVCRCSTYSGIALVASPIFSRKIAKGALNAQSVSILNGETPVDVWTLALHARRIRPRLKSQFSGCVSLVKIHSSHLPVALRMLRCRAYL